MAWKKNSPEAIGRFDEYAACRARSEASCSDARSTSLAESATPRCSRTGWCRWLSPKDAAELIAKGGKTFEPFKGRPMKGRIVVPDAIVTNPRALRAWVGKAARHAREQATTIEPAPRDPCAG